MDICTATTARGFRCSFKAKCGSYCGVHSKIYNRKCSVCLQDVKSDNRDFGCEHFCHEACAEKMRFHECPACVKCAICLEKVKKKEDAGFQCGCKFHLECAQQLRSDQCPICRTTIKSRKLKSTQVRKMQQRAVSDQRQRNEELTNQLLGHNNRSYQWNQGVIYAAGFMYNIVQNTARNAISVMSIMCDVHEAMHRLGFNDCNDIDQMVREAFELTFH